LSPSNLPHDNISLKDLIIKLAGQIEAAQSQDSKPDEEEVPQAGSEVAESAKNKRFEKILSELMASSKESTPDDETKDAETSSGTGERSDMLPLGLVEPKKGEEGEKSELLGMILTIRNKVNGGYVKRPERFTKDQSWVVEYAIEQLDPARAQNLYENMLRRRKNLLSPEEKETAWNRGYLRRLQSLSRKGRTFRRKADRQAMARPVKVYGVEEPLKWTDVFQDREADAATPKKQW